MWPFSRYISVSSKGILQGMTDCHSHLLPRLDDDVRTAEESLRILEEMERQGIRKLWLTPQIMEDIPNTTDALKTLFRTLCESYRGNIRLELAAEYMDALRQMSEDFSIENDVRTSALSRYPEVLTVEEQTVDEDELWHFLEPAITKACEGLVETRSREGEQLKNDLIAKLDGMLAYVAYIEERSPQIIADYRARLEDKVRDLLGDTNIDEGRIAMETTIYADKLCVDEEIVRLKSHIEATRTTLVNGGSVGRKLDFIAQEMNREANTILSKANDLLISNTAIDLKTDIEKVREQIQNIE